MNRRHFLRLSASSAVAASLPAFAGCGGGGSDSRTRLDDRLLVTRFPVGGSSSDLIYTARPDGTQARTLSSLTTAFDEGPRWSRDRSRIAYLGFSSQPPRGAIRLADGNGLNSRELVTGPEFQDFDLSPDGTKLVYRAARGERTSGGELVIENALFLLDIATNTTVTVAPYSSAIAFSRPTFGPDNAIYAVLFNGGPTQSIVRVNLNGQRQFIVAANRPRRLDISPDNRTLLYDSTLNAPVGPNGFVEQLFRVNLDGSNVQRLTNSLFNERFATFSPDGARFAWVSERSLTPSSVFIAQADGSNPREIEPLRGTAFLDWR